MYYAKRYIVSTYRLNIVLAILFYLILLAATKFFEKDIALSGNKLGVNGIIHFPFEGFDSTLVGNNVEFIMIEENDY